MKVSVSEADSRVVREEMPDRIWKPLLLGYPIKRPELQGIVERLGIDERTNRVAAEVDCLDQTMIQCA